MEPQGLCCTGDVRREEREALLRESVTRAQTSRDRRQLEGVREDLRSSPLRANALPLRLRNFAPAADGYLAALGGPLPYMTRLREIESMTADHLAALAAEHEALAHSVPRECFASEWRALVAAWGFEEVNDLIARHNRWFPAESRLPMDPTRGDFALVNGRDYRLAPLDPEWALSRFPEEPENDVPRRNGAWRGSLRRQRA